MSSPPCAPTGQAMDQRLMDWAEGLQAETPSRLLSFFSVSYQKQITMPYVVAVMHLFNHQTHHRGQITTLLTQLGADIGPTDLPVMPGWQ
ncbi:DinB family protein [Aquabacterium sp. NJ1]|uniref:DinB family protein n=1 Tax=Aquabacterium sp. NJ1 TaxID=1538295 RepID=UPI00190F3BBD|nr:DinB family protein [Aquabacterium sp. NJ1]